MRSSRVITDASNIEVWRWNSDPFGTTDANEDPDGDGIKLTYNLRFPGQYYDAETGKHYNYFRDYDPSTGRYIQSDPIGLSGGHNTYLYANASPLLWLDPFGLDTCKYLGTFNDGDPYSYLKKGDPERIVLFQFNSIHYRYEVGGSTPGLRLPFGGPPISFGPIPVGYWINEFGYNRTEIYRVFVEKYIAKYQCEDECGNTSIENIRDKDESKELVDTDIDWFLENVGYRSF